MVRRPPVDRTPAICKHAAWRRASRHPPASLPIHNCVYWWQCGFVRASGAVPLACVRRVSDLPLVPLWGALLSVRRAAVAAVHDLYRRGWHALNPLRKTGRAVTPRSLAPVARAAPTVPHMTSVAAHQRPSEATVRARRLHRVVRSLTHAQTVVVAVVVVSQRRSATGPSCR